MKPRRWLGALSTLLLLAVLPLLAEPPIEETDSLPVYESGIATLDLGPTQVPITYSITPLGPLFSLHPLTANLGGELKLGPLNLSHELTVGGATYLFGPDSSAVTAGIEIYPLTQRPAPAVDGLKVPLDLLQTIYGEQLGYDFQWDQSSRRLTARRIPARQIAVDIDLVHLQGVTTVVLQFPSRPRYRVRQALGQVSVELLGDQLEPGSSRSFPADPFVKQILQTEQSIRLVLAEGAEAQEYTLQQPFRLVFDVYRSSKTAVALPTAPSPPRRAQGIRTIVIDPGHGGGDTGALGSSGVSEKELTLRLAQILRSRLEERLPVQVVLTRNEDVEIDLDTRTALANQHKGDLFISLHINSVQDPGARGAETYFLSLQASDERAAQAAATENLGMSTAGADDPLYDLQLILWDLAQSRHLADSQRLASLVQEELNEALDLRNRGVKQAPFRVLLGAAMPAILVECGFLSNPEEEAKLLDPAYRAELVSALVRAVIRFRAQVEGLPVPADEVLR